MLSIGTLRIEGWGRASITAVFILCFFAVNGVHLVVLANGWSYNAASPSSPTYWGRVSLTCSAALSPWQSPIVLEEGDVRQSAFASSAPRSCLITSVLNSSEPLTAMPMRLERLMNGLLVVRPLTSSARRGLSANTTGPNNTIRRFIQGLTVRITVAEGGAVELVRSPTTNATAVQNTNDLYRLDAIAIHSGSEHAARLWGAVGEIQFILNPLFVDSEGVGGGESGRTTVVSVPLVVPTSSPLDGPRLQSPARSLLSQLLREVRELAATATTSESIATATSSSGSTTRAAGSDDSAYGEGGGTNTDSSGSGTTSAPSTVDLSVAGVGGLSGVRRFYVNTVPFLPVPVALEESECHSSHSSGVMGAGAGCQDIVARLRPTSSYIYDGTITFPPCLPMAEGNSSRRGQTSVGSTEDLRRQYLPSAPVRFLPTSIGGDAYNKIPISIPTVRHIVMAPFLTTQQTINNIALLTGSRATTVEEVATASPSSLQAGTTTLTTYSVPITTSRPAQPRNGRSFTSATTLLPLFLDVNDVGRLGSNRLNIAPRMTAVLGGSTRISGLTALSQSVTEHHLVLVRRSAFNARLETAIIVMSFLCAAVACYAGLLLCVRFDIVEIPTICGGKRVYVDFWTNPKSVLPAGVDAFDDSPSSGSSEDDEGYAVHRNGRVTRTTWGRRGRPGRSRRSRHRRRSWVQDDEDDSDVDGRMLMAMQSIHRPGTNPFQPQRPVQQADVSLAPRDLRGMAGASPPAEGSGTQRVPPERTVRNPLTVVGGGDAHRGKVAFAVNPPSAAADGSPGPNPLLPMSAQQR